MAGKAIPFILVMTAVLLAGSILSDRTFSLPSAKRQEELERIVRHDCGSCHGMMLSGGLGPPFDAEKLGAASDEALALIIRDGVPGTPMPGWGPLLGDGEINWIVSYLRRESQSDG